MHRSCSDVRCERYPRSLFGVVAAVISSIYAQMDASTYDDGDLRTVKVAPSTAKLPNADAGGTRKPCFTAAAVSRRPSQPDTGASSSCAKVPSIRILPASAAERVSYLGRKAQKLPCA